MTSAPHSDLDRFLAGEKERIDRALATVLVPAVADEPWLVEAMAYSLAAGGKRLRPVLALHACEVLGGREEDVLPAACALELIHTFSLIHDDLPAMDDDDLRRGKPTNHVVFGEGLAILAGDGLAVRAFELIVERAADLALAARLVREVAAGTMAMIFGQTADLHWEDRKATPEALISIHRQKTAGLFRSAARVGALAARAGDAIALRFTRYGEKIGLAFQIADDLLDLTATEERMGKRVGKDAEKGKNTYPSTFGAETAVRDGRRCVDEAVEALASIPGTGRLVQLARHIMDRNQ